MPFTICRNRRRREQMSDAGLRMADVRDPHPPSAMAFTICRKQGAETVVPSWDRRGGCASRKYCKAPLKAQTGWSVRNDHTVRTFLTFDGAATPPVPGGDYSFRTQPISAHRFLLLIVILFFAACRQKMADQPRYDPYDESTFFP